MKDLQLPPGYEWKEQVWGVMLLKPSKNPMDIKTIATIAYNGQSGDNHLVGAWAFGEGFNIQGTSSKEAAIEAAMEWVRTELYKHIFG